MISIPMIDCGNGPYRGPISGYLMSYKWALDLNGPFVAQQFSTLSPFLGLGDRVTSQFTVH